MNDEEIQIEMELLPEEYDPVVKLLELPDTCFKCEGPVDDNLCWPNYNEAHTIESSMGYGSKWDTRGFRIAICDRCIANGVLKGTLRLMHGERVWKDGVGHFFEDRVFGTLTEDLKHAQWILDLMKAEEKWEEYVDGFLYAQAEVYEEYGDEIPEWILFEMNRGEEE